MTAAPDSLLVPLQATRHVAVLLDGDADFFDKAFMAHGAAGGRLAAFELHQAISDFAQAGAQHVEILCMVFWNAAGLEKYLRGTDPEGFPNAFMQDFTQGFNSAPRGGFSAVDTGPTSQSADRALLRHLECLFPVFDLVVLGGTHDGAAYVPFLQGLGAAAHGRIALLQTTPVLARRLSAFNLPVFQPRGIFDGRDPNNGLRHAMHEPLNRYHERLAQLTRIEAELPSHTPRCLALLVEAFRTLRRRHPDQPNVAFNELAGALGGDSLLSWSRCSTEDTRTIRVHELVLAQTQTVINGPSDFILKVGVPSGLVKVGGQGAGRSVALNIQEQG